MKNIFLSVLLFCIFLESRACGPYYYEIDSEYYNLFMQELIDDPRYFPFLLTLQTPLYLEGKEKVNNENLVQWQAYFKELSYEEVRDLVFDSEKESLDSLLARRPVSDLKLSFLTPSFIKKYKKALEYLSYAKYLEPYMIINFNPDEWSYYEGNSRSIDLLDYEKEISFLKKKWKSVKEKELRLRYGYQLVRLAHYAGQYESAIDFFNQFVELLNYRPAIYYYALDQKAGAERGLGRIIEANADFFRVVSHSSDRRESALTSIRFSEKNEYSDFTAAASTIEEKNDAYLLLGYFDFSNPLNEIEKIMVNSPDAVQAKVLMARVINTLEREILPIYYWGRETLNSQDKRYPVIKQNYFEYLSDALALSIKMAGSDRVMEKDYWNLTVSYLCFLSKDYSGAKQYLKEVRENKEIYIRQKKDLALYIDISEHSKITGELEKNWYERYKEAFEKAGEDSFVIDVLANRYYIQEDYAKSFLLTNKLTELENNPQLELIERIEQFYQKEDKNELEQYMAKKASAGDPNPSDYLRYLKGMIYLTRGEFDAAASMFSNNYGKTVISDNIFGYNRIECFECEEDRVMGIDYTDDFPFIEDRMDEKEIAEALIQLKKAGEGKGEKAAKANYLIGNFFYNTTYMGYYRHYLRFDNNNYYCWKYERPEREPDIYADIYFKYYPGYYKNPLFFSRVYLEKAYKQGKNKELKARIAFALSKCELQHFENTYDYRHGGDGYLISDRYYFKELQHFAGTDFYREVQTNCKYFNYYVMNCL